MTDNVSYIEPNDGLFFLIYSQMKDTFSYIEPNDGHFSSIEPNDGHFFLYRAK